MKEINLPISLTTNEPERIRAPTSPILAWHTSPRQLIWIAKSDIGTLSAKQPPTVNPPRNESNCIILLVSFRAKKQQGLFPRIEKSILVNGTLVRQWSASGKLPTSKPQTVTVDRPKLKLVPLEIGPPSPCAPQTKLFERCVDVLAKIPNLDSIRGKWQRQFRSQLINLVHLPVALVLPWAELNLMPTSRRWDIPQLVN